MSDRGTLAYESRGVVNRRPPNKRTALCTGIAVAVVVAANVYLVSVAAVDRSWGALQIMIMVGPITNAVGMVLSLAMTPVVRHISQGAAVFPYVIAAIAVPIISIFVDAGCILSMGLHGC